MTQRPQHLMARFARHRRVLFVEEAIPTAHHRPYLEFHAFDGTPVTAVRPRVPDSAAPDEAERLLAGLYDQMVTLLDVRDPVLWFYTPMLWPAAAHLAADAAAVVYDCMDELAAFDFAPPGLAGNEAALLAAPAAERSRRPTRRRSPVRGSAMSGSSTSGWTSGSSLPWRRRGRIGRS